MFGPGKTAATPVLPGAGLVSSVPTGTSTTPMAARPANANRRRPAGRFARSSAHTATFSMLRVVQPALATRLRPVLVLRQSAVPRLGCRRRLARMVRPSPDRSACATRPARAAGASPPARPRSRPAPRISARARARPAPIFSAPTAKRWRAPHAFRLPAAPAVGARSPARRPAWRPCCASRAITGTARSASACRTRLPLGSALAPLASSA
jgi:hypothetical protein